MKNYNLNFFFLLLALFIARIMFNILFSYIILDKRFLSSCNFAAKLIKIGI